MEMDNGFSLLLPRARASFSHTVTVTGSVRFSYHSHCLRSLIMHRSALSSTASRLHIFLILPSVVASWLYCRPVCLPPPPRPNVLDAARLDRARTQMDGFIFPTFFFPSIVRSSPSEFTTSRVVCYWCYSAAAVFVVVVVFSELFYTCSCLFMCVCRVGFSVCVWVLYKLESGWQFCLFQFVCFINFKICNKFSII